MRSGANPALKVLPLGDTSSVPTGCGTGPTMAEGPALDDPGGATVD
ncbi:MAG TPA: hypothetical protein VE575_10430 [Acidimicrobiales bacterium]|nr:hypothetical protein [Acidimicrobiales bacterium]